MDAYLLGMANGCCFMFFVTWRSPARCENKLVSLVSIYELFIIPLHIKRQAML